MIGHMCRLSIKKLEKLIQISYQYPFTLWSKYVQWVGYNEWCLLCQQIYMKNLFKMPHFFGLIMVYLLMRNQNLSANFYIFFIWVFYHVHSYYLGNRGRRRLFFFNSSLPFPLTSLTLKILARKSLQIAYLCI